MHAELFFSILFMNIHRRNRTLRTAQELSARRGQGILPARARAAREGRSQTDLKAARTGPERVRCARPAICRRARAALKQVQADEVMSGRMTYLLGQRAAQELDVELMQVPGFSIDQLMELAGLSVAAAIAAVWPVASRLLVVCGPGNNGGDGLVASRHLSHFGYKPTVLYPKEPKTSGNGPLYSNLLAQCRDLDIPILSETPGSIEPSDYDGVVDALFGFSFSGSDGVRAPYDVVLDRMLKTSVPVASVDVPSGWDVEKGDETGAGLKPHLLVSLTAPKLCAANFTGPHHFLGGRFLPPRLAKKYGLEGLPPFPGVEQVVRLPSGTGAAAAAASPEDCKM